MLSGLIARGGGDVVVVAAVLVVGPDRAASSPTPGPCITALMTAAANALALRGCPAGSPPTACLKSGSTNENDGSLPAAASVKNWSILRDVRRRSCVARSRDDRDARAGRCSSRASVMPCASSRSKIVPFGGGGAVSDRSGRADDAGRGARDEEAPVRVRLRRAPSRTSGRTSGNVSRERRSRRGCRSPSQ